MCKHADHIKDSFQRRSQDEGHQRQTICRKQHENQRNWMGEGRLPSAPWIHQLLLR